MVVAPLLYLKYSTACFITKNRSSRKRLKQSKNVIVTFFILKKKTIKNVKKLNSNNM